MHGSLALSHMASGQGTSASTAADVEITIGFRPRLIMTWNSDTTNSFNVVWADPRDKDDGGNWIAAPLTQGFVSSNTGATSILNSGGIEATDRGFTLGASCQRNSAKYAWVAFG